MKSYDGMIVSSGPYEFVWTEDTDDDGRRSGWWECSRCEATGFGDTFTGDHNCEPCPECDSGHVVETGRMCRETGHTPVACSEGCGWTS